MIRHNILNNSAAAQKFIEGIWRLKDPGQFPWPGQPNLSIYDAFVFWHHQSMMLMTPPRQSDRNAAHSGPVFLPWHRYFLIRLEGFLQQALNDSTFRIPYWDWTADAELFNPSTSPIWTNALLGQFMGGIWRVRLAMNAITGNLQFFNRPLQRRLGTGGGRLPTRQDVRTVIQSQTVYDQAPFSSSSIGGLRNYLEGWVGPARIHNNVHVWVGGDMQLSSSPNDPVFFLHHCNVDRIWAAWQQRYPAAPYVPNNTASETLLFHRLDDALYSIFNENITPRNMITYQNFYQYDTVADLAN